MLPDWLDPLPDAEQMRATDRWAIEARGIPSLELMEQAGAAAADLVTEVAPSGAVLVVCGGGNNGGDGLVVARLLREAGREVRVLTTAPPEDFEGDAKANLDRLPGDPPEPYDGALDDAAVIVDAILGTGFSGTPREPARHAIVTMSEASAPVVAIDVPSGVDASTGAVHDVAVRATATATFHRAKPGLWIHPGKEHAGAVRVVDIGIPEGEPVAPSAGVLGHDVLGLLPGRDAAATKFSSGHVLVAGGSTGLTGAPCLAAEAAMRAGAGYVTCAVPGSLNAIFETRLLEVMTKPVPDGGAGNLTPDGVDAILEEAADRGGTLVVGPGLGKADAALELARELSRWAEVPLLLDADGLNAHAGKLDDLARRPGPTILTPHAGELARLIGAKSDEVNAERLRHARETAAAADAVVVLKGDDTIVADSSGRVAISPGGAPALATAGTGDVLSGVIGAMLAKGLEPFDAACAGVRLHLDAGRRAASERHPDSVIASDVIDALSRAR